MHAFERLIQQQLRVPDNRSVRDWIFDQRIRPPGGARGTQMDLSLTPWLIEPAEAIADNHNREVVMLMPTGGGKTTVLDASILHCTREDPGSVLLAMQTDADAAAYWDERLEPQLMGLDGIGQMIRDLPRNKRRKCEIVLPHMSMFIVGAKISAFQRKSVRYVFLDEVWQVNHGLVGEARARHHDRWNARVVLVSQGGWETAETDSGSVKTELFEAFERTDKREWCFECPDCHLVQPFRWKQLKWGNEQEIKRKDGTIDEALLAASVHYQCAGCERTFSDDITTRRMLANSGRYVATNTNFLRKPGNHVGFHCNALTRYELDWSTLVVQWLKANELSAAGDKTALIEFIQKRLAEFWADPDDDPGTINIGSGYCKADLMDGQKIDNEAFRFLTIDRQRDHRWAVCRAWRHDGTSRLIWEGKVLTAENCDALAQQLKIPKFKDVVDRREYSFVFQDAQFETGEVYDEAVKFGWSCMHGSGTDGFWHVPPNRKRVKKFWSPRDFAAAPSGGRARYFHWCGDKVKDTLAILRDGKGPAWETADDSSLDYRVQMMSEIKKDVLNKMTKRPEQRWVKIGTRPNHMWDAEAMQVCLAMIHRILAMPGATDDNPEQEKT